MNFSLSQNLEMKVLSKRDTSGVKKIKLIDELRLSGSYNFLADSMGLSTIPISFRTTLFGNFGINLSATLNLYKLTPDGNCTTSSSFRDVSNRRAGRSATPSNRVRTVRNAPSTTSRAFRPNT